MGQIRICFAVTLAQYEASQFFSFCSFTFKNQDTIFFFEKKIAYRAKIWEQIVYTGYCDMKHNMGIDRASKQIPFGQKRDVMHYNSVDQYLKYCF